MYECIYIYIYIYVAMLKNKKQKSPWMEEDSIDYDAAPP